MISLNSEQRRAVETSLKPTLVIAGAGTGKTRVLIERIIKLINEDGIDPRQILIITFTNKARDEIRNRIKGRIGDSRIPTHIFTFHAFFHKVLRTDMEFLYKNLRNFKVMDENDQRAIIRRLIKPLQIYTDDFQLLDAKIAEKAISLVKIITRDLETEEGIVKIAGIVKITVQELKQIYKLYQDELRKNNVCDYNDLEVYIYKLFDRCPEVRDKWKRFFKAILIDEFQDTSELQMEIVKQLADEESNIFCVGDPDQSIYGFRGAKPMICSEFLDYFGAECIKLEQNYRSTQTILDVANRLIVNNHSDQKIYKQLKSVNSQIGSKVKCVRFGDEWEEARFVADEIERLIKVDPGTKLKDFAILYRNNVFARIFEIIFRERKIECEVANTVDFFSRAEIKFIVAFLRILYFYDEIGVGMYIQPVVSNLSIDVGEKSCHSFYSFLSEGGMNLEEGIMRIEECQGVSAKAKKGLIKFWGWIQQLLSQRDLSFLDLTDEIVKITGYAEKLREKKEEGRLENIRRFAEGLDRNPEKQSKKDIVHEISLRAKEIKSTEADDYLFLSTIHQAKGLEYKYVFVVKMSQGIFPSDKFNNNHYIEEERRLAYVAWTRAKKSLYITCSPLMRRNIKHPGSDRPSMFIDEILGLVSRVEYIDRSREIFNSYRNFSRYG